MALGYQKRNHIVPEFWRGARARASFGDDIPMARRLRVIPHAGGGIAAIAFYATAVDLMDLAVFGILRNNPEELARSLNRMRAKRRLAEPCIYRDSAITRDHIRHPYTVFRIDLACVAWLRLLDDGPETPSTVDRALPPLSCETRMR